MEGLGTIIEFKESLSRNGNALSQRRLRYRGVVVPEGVGSVYFDRIGNYNDFNSIDKITRDMVSVVDKLLPPGNWPGRRAYNVIPTVSPTRFPVAVSP